MSLGSVAAVPLPAGGGTDQLIGRAKDWHFSSGAWSPTNRLVVIRLRKPN